MQEKRYDFIIIGSGAGGSPLAWYLTRAGHSVLMLEAGKRWRSRDYPDNELHANARLMWNGGMDTSRDAGFLFLRGKVLGGGTVVNQCLLDRFDAAALDPWAEQSGIDDFSVDRMARHYDAVESVLSLQKITREQWNENARLYAEGFEKLGYRCAPLRRGQSQCNVEEGNDCIRCLGGCPRDSKQSMPVTFLRRAEASGLEVVTDCHVDSVEHGNEQVRVRARIGNEEQTFTGRRCVLAAGTFGTTEILLRSGFADKLPALGDGFFCHPQFVTLGFYERIIDAHKGSFQALKSDDPRFRESGFKLENVFMGPLGTAYLLPGFGAWHLHNMRQYRHLACIEVAVRDVTPGRIGMGRNNRLDVRKKVGKAERERARGGLKVIHDLYRATGASRVVESPVRIGLHLMGGCGIGTDRRRSVVNPEYQVHGHPNLYVVDGSLFPTAPGINPSLSIMALSHRAAEVITGTSIKPEAAKAEEVQA